MRVANGMTVALAAAVLSTLLGPRVASAALAPIDCRICIADPSFPACAEACPATCGDWICGPGEDAVSCPQDCGECGDGVCGPGEDPVGCPQDCAVCGDAVCGFGETPASCPDDCGPCGDGLCAPDVGEDATICPADCFCGNTVCEPSEAGGSCPADCGPCGDGQCQPQETPCDCPVDCFCGDGVCRIDHGEDPVDCELDCPGWCGDGYCAPSEGIGAVEECPDDCAPVCSLAEDEEPQPCPVEATTAITATGCDPAVLGGADGCDCGCGVPDPDCAASPPPGPPPRPPSRSRRSAPP
jgi:hypothetical protein